jgi:hypothetical protein
VWHQHPAEFVTRVVNGNARRLLRGRCRTSRPAVTVGLTIAVKILAKQCFGSAGCVII